MKYTTLFFILLVTLVVAGCSTIEFVDTTQVRSFESYESMHHNLVYSLIEISDPVDLRQCESGWQSVVVEDSVLTVIVGNLDSFFIGIDVWDPWAVTIHCAQ